VVLGILALINISVVIYIFKELKRREKLFDYNISTLQLYVKNFEWYQDILNKYIDELGKHTRYQHESIVEYQEHLAQSIRDLPKEIVIKNVLKIP
jgi:hypothetical protein